jgi:hypothetical protein
MSGLLLVLTSEQAQIRRAGVQVIKELYSIAEEESTMFSSLHKRIVRCEEEIESDSMYINQVSCAILCNIILYTICILYSTS